MLSLIIALVGLFATTVVAQQGSTLFSAENHPLITTQKCTKAGGCVSQQSRLVIDANWRWVHSAAANYSDCFHDPAWNSSLCPDPVTCAKNCALEGVSTSTYQQTYGVYTSGNSLTMQLFPGTQNNIGSRLFLMSDDTHYQMIQLANQEVSFDVDVSGLPCGTNGALYFVDMSSDGGRSAYANNKAGAQFGTGYCDAQCRQDLKFVNGEANLYNWNPSARTGRYGSCCPEIDLWEANAYSTAYTAHPCNIISQGRCDSTTSQCTSTCDQAGCDFNPYRMGNTTYYGYGKTIDTNPGKIRVITQFITSNNASTGAIIEIRRFYINRTPKGTVLYNAKTNVAGVSANALTDAYCASEKTAFAEPNAFKTYGGMASVSRAAGVGMVMALSAFVDYAYGMRWLDSVFPDGTSPSKPGALRGPCPTSSGNVDAIKSTYPNAQVTFSNIKWGDIGTTFGPPYP